MKQRMSGKGGNGNDFEGKPDDGSGAAKLDVPRRCEGCPYVEGVTREHAAAAGLEERRKDVVHRSAQCEIDEVTASCPGLTATTAESQSSEGTFRGCNSPVLDEGKRTGRYVSLTDIVQSKRGKLFRF